ncbi:hypothetical protein PR001_g6141 [Phytophthora rubi]|uniref:Uncharacterized protein n=1 Tax=Phytophthora rubi TaxID=129364 RepID=A0A6A3MQT1_9STRA|nr:hypothetical protein PR002_g9601 [Phytophthora rubi]KAE9042570.1 hypothetical protein PR001_g6141 [Phytophthora rubi]
MEEQTVNCFPGTAAAHALETPAIRHSAQQLVARMTKNQPSVRSISAGNAPQPRVDNIGDCGIATSSPSGDREFFLDEFIAENDNKKIQNSGKVAQDNGGQGKRSRQNSSHFETVRIVPDHSATKTWAPDGLVKLSASGGGGGSLSVKVSMSKKRPLPVVQVKIHEKEEEAPEQWTRAEFMTSTRSASQQAAIELGVQMAWGLKFAAGRVHSMISLSQRLAGLAARIQDAPSKHKQKASASPTAA